MTQTLYRVENPITMQGLWYDKDGRFNPLITKLSNAKCRDLPMGYDPLLKVDGLAWYSACDNIPDMQNWFSHQDLIELQALGYGLWEFDVARYHVTNGHAAFGRHHVIASRQIDIGVLRLQSHDTTASAPSDEH